MTYTYTITNVDIIVLIVSFAFVVCTNIFLIYIKKNRPEVDLKIRNIALKFLKYALLLLIAFVVYQLLRTISDIVRR